MRRAAGVRDRRLYGSRGHARWHRCPTDWLSRRPGAAFRWKGGYGAGVYGKVLGGVARRTRAARKQDLSLRTETARVAWPQRALAEARAHGRGSVHGMDARWARAPWLLSGHSARQTRR